MTVTGAADPLSEGDAMRQAMLEQRLTAQQRATKRCAPARSPAPQALAPDERGDCCARRIAMPTCRTNRATRSAWRRTFQRQRWKRR